MIDHEIIANIDTNQPGSCHFDAWAHCICECTECWDPVEARCKCKSCGADGIVWHNHG